MESCLSNIGGGRNRFGGQLRSSVKFIKKRVSRRVDMRLFFLFFIIYYHTLARLFFGMKSGSDFLMLKAVYHSSMSPATPLSSCMARNATCSPPLSPIFSPRVCLPLIFLPLGWVRVAERQSHQMTDNRSPRTSLSNQCRETP